MKETIQAKVKKNDTIEQFCFSGYVEITEDSFHSLRKAYPGFLFSVTEPDNGMKSVDMLAGLDCAFLLETNDGRFFVQN